ncbi:hypothetical protein [Candidatus Odyssella acanthamoebae]|uniref:F-box domain-containing protein n=1 Tax=Candidatus Odyssella acanthamoebae TaxID=91604 RepID=A0A077B006_9PROT|nr:hypothetical protein [Candidatus Paracaedibacter acanthamoebae]AIK96285.1 hypothetical protein ID47_05330 [Candidatus Paracaedibacter acanthamoebae]
MKISIKIFLLFFAATSLGSVAMELDESPFSKSNKRPYSSSINREDVDPTEEPQEHKRQRTLSYEIIDELEKKEQHGEEYRDKYKGSEKYKQIDEYRNNLDSLKKLLPEFRKLILGEDAETKWKDLQDFYQQLATKYFRNFLTGPASADFNSLDYLADEVRQRIFFYCSKQDLANLMLVSPETRNAVYSLEPFFQKVVKEVIKWGRYKDINEFFDDVHAGNFRAYTAMGIIHYNGPKGQGGIRNKWLDLALNVHDLSAVSFIFSNQIFKNSQKKEDSVDNLFKIIKNVYENPQVGQDYTLDRAIIRYLDERIELGQNRADLRGEILTAINLLMTSLSGSIEANFILARVFSNGLEFPRRKDLTSICLQAGIPSQDYLRQAFKLVKSLPSFERGVVCFEIGLWELVKLSKDIDKMYTRIPEVASSQFNDSIKVHWTSAIQAWTEAAAGNRQQAVSQLKDYLKVTTLFNLPTPALAFSVTPASSKLTFFSTTHRYQYRLDASIAFKFLSELYQEDKKMNDQLSPYDKDVSLLLTAARNLKLILKKMGPNVKNFPHEVTAVSNYYLNAIQESLKSCNEELKDNMTKKLNYTSQKNLPFDKKIIIYEYILEKLGLGEGPKGSVANS